jgi:hypothetical protein
LKLLTERLGFAKRAGKPAELKKADLEKDLGRSINMKADENGIIRGNTFEFSPRFLHVFADRIESKRLARSPVEVESRYLAPDAIAETIQILRGLAGSRG